MNKLFWLLVILSSSAIAQIDTCLTFSEIMFFPDAGNSEFIEIFNLSPSDSFDLSLYKIKYQNASADFIKAGPAGSILKPLSYAVILEGDYDLTSGIYKSLLFNADLILKIDNNAFGSSGMSNSSGRELYLQNFDNDTIDHYTYSADNKAGISDEKIKMTSNNAPLNFSNSQFVHGTPGFRNSVSPVLKDISVCNFLYSPYSPLSGEVVRFSVQICNQGEQNIDSFSVKVAFSDTMSLNGNVIFFQDCSNLPSGDSLSLSFNYVFNTPGSFIIECEVILPVDQNIMNNKISGLLVISGTAAKYHDIIINEIMCAPADGEPEWIEFINASPEPVNLKDFTVSDILTSPATVKLSITDFYIPAGKYFILSRDSSLKAFHINIPSPIMLASMPVLNNDEDGVVLKDIRGTVIDSVHYDKSFDSKPGRSIEKKEIDYSSTDKNSWAPSTDIEKSTPGRINSISRKDFDLCASNVFCMPQPPIVAENIFLKLKVLNKGRKYAENSTARFLIKNAADTVYNLFSTTTFSLASGDSITLTASVPFTLNNSITVRGEISALLDEDISNNSITREIRPSFRRNNVLINEFMGDPETGEAEWVELLNASGQIINLNGWSVSDILPQPGKVQFCLHDFYFRPSELLVIARDSSLLKNHSGIKNFFTAKFGTLGNTSDGIIIYDAVNYIIDSIQYSAAWKGKKGFSFERFALHLPSHDTSGWMRSLSGSTPGEMNSAMNVEARRSGDIVINEIMYDPDKDNSEFIELYNTSPDTINLGGWKMGNSSDSYLYISDSSLNLPSGKYLVFAADTSIYKNYHSLRELCCCFAGETSLGLNNSGERIFLRDALNNTIDSLYYSPDWHNKSSQPVKNKSLERINPLFNSNDKTNWTTSCASEGATPGFKNSYYLKEKNPENKISVFPNPFSPDNDGFEDFTLISYKLIESPAGIRLRIFDSIGRLVRTINDNNSSGSGTIIFDGKDGNGSDLNLGIYIILFEALDSNNGTLVTLKSIVVVARKL